jgi:hypothetical protein
MGGFFSKSIDFTKDFDLAINEVKIIIDKKVDKRKFC